MKECVWVDKFVDFFFLLYVVFMYRYLCVYFKVKINSGERIRRVRKGVLNFIWCIEEVNSWGRKIMWWSKIVCI